MDAEHFESLAERRIREAIAAGAFDDLPGEGGPTPRAGEPYDPEWWARAYVIRMWSRDADGRVRPADESTGTFPHPDIGGA